MNTFATCIFDKALFVYIFFFSVALSLSLSSIDLSTNDDENQTLDSTFASESPLDGPPHTEYCTGLFLQGVPFPFFNNPFLFWTVDNPNCSCP